jgi:hypothetical protein
MPPLVIQGFARKASVDSDESDDEDDDDADPGSPWEGEDAEIFYDEVDQELREHASSYLDSSDNSAASPAVTYAMQNLPAITNAAFSKAKHTAQVSGQWKYCNAALLD